MLGNEKENRGILERNHQARTSHFGPKKTVPVRQANPYLHK